MDLCQICNQKNAIYTCPRCSFHTCSMICSQSHRVAKSCSGERDKTTYVPMNKYDWGTMTSDYMYLEDVGRKAADWGKQIMQNGLMSRPNHRDGKGWPTRTRNFGGKRETLRLQLQARGIDMELLPAGMEKSKLNKSFYDAKTKVIFMTIELLIHSLGSENHPVRILSRKHNLISTLDNAVRKGIRDYIGRTPNADPCLAQFTELVDLNILMAQTSDTMPMNGKVYYRLNPNETLQKALNSKTFVEYPTIEVWRDGEFSGLLKEETGEIFDVKARVSKDPKSKTRVPSEAITSLLQNYASEDEEEDKQEEFLEMLGEYNTDAEPLDDNMIASTEDEMEDEPSERDLRAILEAAAEDTLIQVGESLTDDEHDKEWNDNDD